MADATKKDKKTLRSNEISAPAWLSQIGKNHYRQLVKQLMDRGTYNPLEKGLIEMMASLYSDSRDTKLSSKERREDMKLYSQLLKTLGTRGGQKDEDGSNEKDLEDFMRD